jgi:diacylglycerol kinase family enzyme
VINHFGIPPIPVALISAGSGNDFARNMLKTTDPRMQLNIALQAYSDWFDVGRCNGKYFLTGVGIGFDGLVARRVGKLKKFIGGSLAYYLTVLGNLLQYQEKRMKIRIPGKAEMEGRYFMATIGNTSVFGGGFKVTPHADPADGMLDLNLISKVGRISRIIHLDKVQKGQHIGLPFVQYMQAEKFRIDTKKIIPCHMDGEVYQWSYFDASLNPKSLNLIVPRPQ